jgi:hypothetical protein
MQIELLNRKKWKTRKELTNAVFESGEVFCDRQHRHSDIGYVLPIEFKFTCNKTPPKVSKK